MKTSADKTQKNKSRAVANTVSRKQSSGGTFQLVDNRPEIVQLQKLQEIIANSPHAKKIAQFQEMMDNSKNPHHVQLRKMQEMLANSQLGKTAVLPGVLQKKGPLDEEELQLKSKEAVQKKGPLDEEELQFKAKDTAQLAGPLDEEELQFKSKEAVQKKGPLDEEELQFKKDEAVQRKGPEDEDDLQFKAKDTAQLAGPLDEDELQFKAEEPVRKQENKTGLPDDLKAGVENLSGMAMDDVRVHYNSGKPAQLNAYAYTQGTEIHVAPGQEKHLPHEAWHVVQQKQGRVQPTMQMAGGVAVNDDKGLEGEADGMGGRALQFVDNRPETIQLRKLQKDIHSNSRKLKHGLPPIALNQRDGVIQTYVRELKNVSEEDLRLEMEKKLTLEDAEIWMSELAAEREVGFTFKDGIKLKQAIGQAAMNGRNAGVAMNDLIPYQEANEDKVVTHYHPQGLPLSDGDIAQLILRRFKMVRAVGQYGTFIATLEEKGKKKFEEINIKNKGLYNFNLLDCMTLVQEYLPKDLTMDDLKDEEREGKFNAEEQVILLKMLKFYKMKDAMKNDKLVTFDYPEWQEVKAKVINRPQSSHAPGSNP